MIILKSPEEIAIMREGGKILASTLFAIAKMAVPGIASDELDIRAEELLRSHGAEPAFRGYHGFPSTLCVSVNTEVVHGIPSYEKVLHDGDLVGLDLGCTFHGFVTDMAVSVIVGHAKGKTQKLLKVTREALAKGIQAVKPGRTVGDIGFAVQHYVERKGFNVVRSLVGHGVGRSVHEDPSVPNYGEQGEGVILTEGMTIAIEPMVVTGDYGVNVLDDGWTVVTEDGGLAAHFEHTVAVTSRGVHILTTV